MVLYGPRERGCRIAAFLGRRRSVHRKSRWSQEALRVHKRERDIVLRLEAGPVRYRLSKRIPNIFYDRPKCALIVQMRLTPVGNESVRYLAFIGGIAGNPSRSNATFPGGEDGVLALVTAPGDSGTDSFRAWAISANHQLISFYFPFLIVILQLEPCGEEDSEA